MRSFNTEVNKVLDELGELLKFKNRAYGNSALKPVRIFSKASALEQLNVRIDDKLSRIQNQNQNGIVDDGEDTEWDLMGYLVLKRIAQKALKDEDTTNPGEDSKEVIQKT